MPDKCHALLPGLSALCSLVYCHIDHKHTAWSSCSSAVMTSEHYTAHLSYRADCFQTLGLGQHYPSFLGVLCSKPALMFQITLHLPAAHQLGQVRLLLVPILLCFTSKCIHAIVTTDPCHESSLLIRSCRSATAANTMCMHACMQSTHACT